MTYQKYLIISNLTDGIKMIYFDNSATTKPCPEAVDAVNRMLCECWGNPSSSHRMGLCARDVIEKASSDVALTLGIKREGDGKVIFTSGGTEANNLAMMGVAFAKKRSFKGGRLGTVIITDGEHASVDATAEKLSVEGFNVVKIPTVGGKLDLDFLEKNVTDDIVFASLMLVNNETGAVYDVKKAAKIIKEASPSAIVHSDCVQAYCKMPLTLVDLGVDMVSVSAHKIFAPKGAGALAVSKKVLTAKNLSPILYGGGQEGGFRSGTEALPAIAGFAAAAVSGHRSLKERAQTVKALSERLCERLSGIGGVRINFPETRLPNILNITVFNIKSETMLNFLSAKGICVSKSSACSSHSRNLSRALTAFGMNDGEVDSSLRISFSHTNTEEETDVFCKTLEEGISSLAKIKR